jgi:hypothetical protein
MKLHVMLLMIKSQSKKTSKLDVKNLAARYMAECNSRTTTLQQAAVTAKSRNSLVDVIVTDIAEGVEKIKKICVLEEQQADVDNLLAAVCGFVVNSSITSCHPAYCIIWSPCDHIMQLSERQTACVC